MCLGLYLQDDSVNVYVSYDTLTVRYINEMKIYFADFVDITHR